MPAPRNSRGVRCRMQRSFPRVMARWRGIFAPAAVRASRSRKTSTPASRRLACGAGHWAVCSCRMEKAVLPPANMPAPASSCQATARRSRLATSTATAGPTSPHHKMTARSLSSDGRLRQSRRSVSLAAGRGPGESPWHRRTRPAAPGAKRAACARFTVAPGIFRSRPAPLSSLSPAKSRRTVHHFRPLAVRSRIPLYLCPPNERAC